MSDEPTDKPTDKQKDDNAAIHALMVELTDEWHDNADRGCDVLASDALDRLKELIEEVYP